VTTVIVVRDHGTGRIEHEILGSTPFANVPESPYYAPSPGSFLSTRAWVDRDGVHAVLAHDCRETREVHVLRWPTWQVVDNAVSPSYSCDGCGLHTFVPITAVEILTPAPAEPVTEAQGGAE
jgi:hypothetical protein